MTKKVVLSGYFGCDNFGDETILSILINRLKMFNTEITVISKNPKKTTKTYDVKAIETFNFYKISRTIKKSDVLISGGGSLLQDATSVKSLFYYLWVIFTAVWNRKKVVIFAQGIGPINNKFGLFLTKFLLKKARWVSVRDDKSLFLLRGLGIKTTLVCDPLYDLKLNEASSKNKVGVQLRNFKTLTDNLLLTLANRIAIDFPDKEIEIYSFQDSVDLDVCERFQDMLKTINPSLNVSLFHNMTQQETLDRISELEYMIAMRFHAVLLAIKYGIKTLSICYDEKVENISKEAGIPALSMLANENYGYMFNQLKILDSKKLLEYAYSKKFDWSTFDIFFN